MSDLNQEIIDLATDIGNALRIRGFKSGGTAGQVPVKANGTDFNWGWTDLPSSYQPTSAVSTNPTSGSTITIPITKEDHVRKIAASATISALTIALPSAANSRDCQTVAVVGNQIVTTLTFTAGSGATIAGTASFTTVAGTFYSFVFCLADNTWNRIA